MALGHAFYVSPSGDDASSGREKHPFQTLPRAVRAVREWRTTGGDGPARIVLREGRYPLQQTVVLGIQDGLPGSGQAEPQNEPGAGPFTEPAYLTFAAHPGEKAVISGGVEVNGWKRLRSMPEGLPHAARGKVWVADMPEGVDRFNTLYDGLGRLNRARGKGFNPTREGDRKTLHFPVGALKHCANLEDVEILIRPKNPWTINMLPLASVDEQAGVAKTAVSATYEMSPLRTGTHDLFGVSVWAENMLEGLDEPGEWVVNTRSGKIYLWPRDVDMEGSPRGVLAPALTELIRVEGEIDYDGPHDKPVRGIAFEGVTFSHGDRRGWRDEQDRLGWGLQHDWEMFDRPTALLRFRGAENCRVEHCRFIHSGGTGLRLDLYAKHNRILDNEFGYLGEAGILLAGYGPGSKDVNRNNDIMDNHIHHYSEIIWHAGGIWAWQSGYNRIAHNHLHHSAYTAILVTGRIKPTFAPDDEGGRTIRIDEMAPEARIGGKTYDDWKVREKYMHARHNVVEYNEISHSVRKLSDGNGIYVSGGGVGNMVRYNYLHHNDAATVTEALRCDDDQHETLVYGNIIEDGVGLSALSSKGKNYFINNYVLHSKEPFGRACISFERYPVSGAVVRQNIVVGHAPGGKICHYTKIGADSDAMLKTLHMDRNLYFHGSDPAWADAYLQKMRSGGREKASRFADPLFVDYAGRDYGFKSESPALALGIEPLVKARMGRRSIRPATAGETISLRYAQAELLMHLPADAPEATLSVSDVTGQKVVEARLPVGTSPSYALEGLAPGWYLARVQAGGLEARTQFYLVP